MYKQVFLKPKKEESLKRFHPWVFSGAISHTDKPVEEGEIVEIYDSAKNYIALGHSQIGSIAVRVLSFEKKKLMNTFG
jgi:23S rRNA (cytosine1962-C5)-methyltransferase